MQKFLLFIIGITITSLVVGTVVFFIFRALFGLWIVALIVAITTAICLAIVGGLAIVGTALKAVYQKQLELSSRKKNVFRMSSLFQKGDSQEDTTVVDSTICYSEDEKQTQKTQELRETEESQETQDL